jgi:hypothetical protein
VDSEKGAVASSPCLLNDILLRSYGGIHDKEKAMSHVVAVELEMPDDLARFRLPAALDARLQRLLDRQDRGLVLSMEEREEAEGLVDLAEMLTLLRLRAERAASRS